MSAKTIKTKIAGVTYKNDDGTDRQQIIAKYAKKNILLKLSPEPNNPHSKDAIGVWIPQKRFLRSPVMHQLGYISTHVSPDANRAIAANTLLSAKILAVTGGTSKKKTRGVNIVIHIKDW